MTQKLKSSPSIPDCLYLSHLFYLSCSAAFASASELAHFPLAADAGWVAAEWLRLAAVVSYRCTHCCAQRTTQPSTKCMHLCNLANYFALFSLWYAVFFYFLLSSLLAFLFLQCCSYGCVTVLYQLMLDGADIVAGSFCRQLLLKLIGGGHLIMYARPGLKT